MYGEAGSTSLGASVGDNSTTGIEDSGPGGTVGRFFSAYPVERYAFG